MPLPDQISLLCIAIEDRARREADDIVSRAHRQAEQILASEEEDVKRRLEERIRREREDAYRQASRIADAADLKARQYILREKRQLLSRVLEDARRKVAGFSSDPAYPDFLRNLVLRAVSEVQGTGYRVKINSRDRAVLTPAVMQDISAGTGKGVELMDESADIGGGCLVYSSDMRQMVDYSLDALIERAEPALMDILASEFLKDGVAEDTGKSQGYG